MLVYTHKDADVDGVDCDNVVIVFQLWVWNNDPCMMDDGDGENLCINKGEDVFVMI